jgi:hypothetical protein
MHPSEGNIMQMYNFDLMKKGTNEPLETINNMMRSLDEAKNRCKNLLAGRAPMIGADRIQLRENGGAAIIFSWPEDA